MNKQKSIKLNFVMNALLSMSSFIFPLITFPYVSRILLPEGTGKVSFATSLISYFAMFAQLGIPTYGIRACARVRDDKEKLSKTVHELFIINAVMSLISYIILFVMIFTVPKLQQEKSLYIIISLTLFFNLIGMEWLFKGLEQYTYITVRSVICKVIALVLMFVLVHQKSDYVIYGAITIFAASAAHIMNFFYARKYICFTPMKGYRFKPHLKAVTIFFAMACATTIYTHLDTVMLGFMKTDIDVGYYNAAVKIKTILVSIVTSLGTVLLPRASYYINQGKMEEFRRISTKALNFVFLIAAPLTLYFILFARQGVLFLSGSAYEGAIIPMQIIMPTLILIGLSNILGIQILVPLGKEKIVLVSEIAGAIVDLVLNAVLIPKFASAGAAFGTLAAEVTVLLIQYYVLRKEVNPMIKQINFFKIVTALIIAFAVSCIVQMLNLGDFVNVSSTLNNFIVLAISSVLFFAAYCVTLIVMKEKMISEIFSQFKDKFLKR